MKSPVPFRMLYKCEIGRTPSKEDVFVAKTDFLKKLPGAIVVCNGGMPIVESFRRDFTIVVGLM